MNAQEHASFLLSVMQARHTILPKRLIEPGPDALQLEQLLAAARTAPDHGRLQPWRLLLIPTEQRGALGDCFAQALLERDPHALPEQVEQAREKAFRAPLLMLLVVDGAVGDPDIDLYERMVSAGCAVQNVLLMATAMGFGSALTSGKALKSVILRQWFALHAAEHAVCFVSVGTTQPRKPNHNRDATDPDTVTKPRTSWPSSG